MAETVPKIELTPAAHIVLGLLAMVGEATPYDLKRMVSESVGHFWSLPHSQLYAEPSRLARGGYLTETREAEGRRRKLYEITDKGREALEAWLAVPAADALELRDLALLKLYFGADARALAKAQLETHRRVLATYEAMHTAASEGGEAPRGPMLTLEFGLGHERETVRFWEELAGE